MGKKARILITAASLAVVLALSIGSVVVAAGPNAINDNGACYGQRSGLGGQGICSDAVGDLLGLSPEEIQAQRQDGKSLVQIAAAKSIGEQQLVNAIMAERKAEIQARVTAGTLTQERANLMLKQMEQNIVRAINRTTVGQPEWAGANSSGRGARGIDSSESGLGKGPRNMNECGRVSR